MQTIAQIYLSQPIWLQTLWLLLCTLLPFSMLVAVLVYKLKRVKAVNQGPLSEYEIRDIVTAQMSAMLVDYETQHDNPFVDEKRLRQIARAEATRVFRELGTDFPSATNAPRRLM